MHPQVIFGIVFLTSSLANGSVLMPQSKQLKARDGVFYARNPSPEVTNNPGKRDEVFQTIAVRNPSPEVTNKRGKRDEVFQTIAVRNPSPETTPVPVG